MRDKELLLFDMRDSKRFAKAYGYAGDLADGRLSEVIERKPHSLVSRTLGSVATIRWAEEEFSGSMYIFSLGSVAMQGGELIVRGEAKAYDMHDDMMVDGSPLKVELAMKDVTDTGKSSALACM